MELAVPHLSLAQGPGKGGLIGASRGMEHTKHRDFKEGKEKILGKHFSTGEQISAKDGKDLLTLLLGYIE